MRTLPKVLKYLPSDKAQDARNFVNSLQYWLGGNSENLENFLLNLTSAYVPALKGVDFSTAEPQVGVQGCGEGWLLRWLLQCRSELGQGGAAVQRGAGCSRAEAGRWRRSLDRRADPDARCGNSQGRCRLAAAGSRR